MPAFKRTFGEISPAMNGFTVSFVLLMGAVPAFFAGRLADRYSHLPVIRTGALIFIIGTALQAAAPSLSMLLVGRALEGLGEGLLLTNVAVYVVFL